MSHLLACPFCRELFANAEASTCPHCDVALSRVEKLPPSYEVQQEQALALQAIPPEDRRLPLTYLRRGRGALLLLATLGIALFFCPWVDIDMPEDVTLRGFDLARRSGGWFWGGAVGWFIMLPLVATRRTVMEMRGVRLVVAAFAGITLVQTGVMLALPPSTERAVPVAYEFAWGIYSSLCVALVGVVQGLRFGGRVDDLPASLGLDPQNPHHEMVQETSVGETLH